MNDLIGSLTDSADKVGIALAETGYMVVFSLAAAVLVGLPLGVLTAIYLQVGNAWFRP